MVKLEIQEAISNYLLSALTKKDKEIARLIFDDKSADQTQLHIWQFGKKYDKLLKNN